MTKSSEKPRLPIREDLLLRVKAQAALENMPLHLFADELIEFALPLWIKANQIAEAG